MGNKPSRLKVEDVNGTWAIIPTPAIAAGDDWRTEDSVDYDEVARADRIAKTRKPVATRHTNLHVYCRIRSR